MTADSKIKNYVFRAIVKRLLPKAVKINIFLLVFLVTALSIITAPFSPAYSNPKSMDIVLVIDTSGSMKKTDPNNLRSEASELFISLLKEQNSVALVTFDTTAKTLSGLHKLESEREQLLDRLNLITSVGEWTDLREAVSHSYQILKRSSEKEKAIILMTDGKMDLGKAGLDKEATAELLEELIPAVRKKGIKIYTIAFTKFSDISFLKLIALKTKGFFYLTEKDTDIHITYTDIFNHMTSPETLPIEGYKFYVDMSVEEMTIVITKAYSTADVTLIMPDKLSQTFEKHPGDIKWSKASAYEMITVSKPMVGQWHIKYGAEKGNKVFIVTNLRLMTSMKKSVIKLDSEQELKIWLQDGPPETDKTGPAHFYGLGITAWTTLVDGEDVVPLILNDEGSGYDKKADDGIFTSLLNPTMPGEYALNIRVKGATFEREKKYSFYVPAKEQVQLEELVDEIDQPEPVIEEKNEPPPEQPVEEIRWGWVFIRFFIINVCLLIVVAGIVVFKKYKKTK
ncbi:MAG: VWA domain-containing protein [Thermodesulfobacteriota bacterium]|nr:VWA domain-containing protein [Thermodesulfobacteriota bacterium]